MRRAADLVVVVDPAAAVLPEARAAVEVVVARVADKAAVVVSPVAVVVVSPVAADKVVVVAVVLIAAVAVVDKAVVDKAVVDKAVVDKAAALAEDVPAAAVAKVVDKVVEVEAAGLVVAAVKAVVVVEAEWEEAAVVDVRPEVVGAAEAVSSSHSSGASQCCGAPFFY